MHILVSFCNLRAPGGPAIGLFDPHTSEFRVLNMPATLSDCTGITGLAITSRFVFAAVQASYRVDNERPDSLAVFDAADFRLLNHYPFRLAVDVHSLCISGSRLYVVSTGTDEVISLLMKDECVLSESVFWRPEVGLPRADHHHLNTIIEWEGELLVSGFGRKNEKNWTSARDGFIINPGRNERIATGLDQPHSVIVYEGSIVCCESRRMAVLTVGDGPSQQLPGYSRGLCHVNDKLYAATSIGRKISKSTGEINNPAESGPARGECSICRISAKTFEVEQVLEMGLYAQEIYDLLPVENVTGWAVTDETVWRDTTIRELAAAVDKRTTWAKQTSAALEDREATILDLQSQISRNESLHESEMLNNVLAQQGTRLDEFQLQLRDAVRSELTEQFAETKSLLQAFQEQILEQGHLIQNTIFDLLRAGVAPEPGGSESAKGIAYRHTVERICTIVQGRLPKGAVVVVASKGDDELLRLPGRIGWHFPRNADGLYAGHYPAGSVGAIAHLEALRQEGAQFLARSQNLWVKSIRKSGVVSWECAGRAALSLSHSAQSRSQRRATASEAHCRRFGLEP